MHGALNISNQPEILLQIHQSVCKHQDLYEQKFDLPHGMGLANKVNLNLKKGLQFFIVNYQLSQKIIIDNDLLITKATCNLNQPENLPSLIFEGFVTNNITTNKNETYSTLEANEPICAFNFCIHHDYLLDLCQNEPENLPNNIIQVLNGHQVNYTFSIENIKVKLQYSINRLLSNTQTGIAKNIYFESKALEILTQIIQLLAEEETVKSAVVQKLKNSDLKKVEEAKSWIDNNLESQFFIKDLAKQVSLNEQYLKLGFKQLTGKTIFEYTQDEKMLQAKSLLAQKQMTVSEIAIKLGYSCVSHFSANFKKYTGINPSEYIESI